MALYSDVRRTENLRSIETLTGVKGSLAQNRKRRNDENARDRAKQLTFDMAKNMTYLFAEEAP